MESIISLLQQGTHFIIPLIVLLGVLIFVHELGHFSVAKYFGVRVETFSLGFGKKILQKKYGDTVYCISAIPFGGYVKMYGDDPSAKVASDQKKYSFLHQPVLPRIAIVLAGPLMNALFAFLLFIVLAGIGERSPQPKLGDIFPGSASYAAGFRSGDVIEKIDSTSIEHWGQIKKLVEDNSDMPLTFSVKRGDENLQIKATPQLTKNKDPIGLKPMVGDIEGLTFLVRAPTIGVISTFSMAAKSGFKTGDYIKKVNGKEVDSYNDLKTMLVSGAIVLVERAQVKKDLEIILPDFKRFEDLGIESSDLYLSAVAPQSGAEKAGIQPGDKIVSINGSKIANWEAVVKTVQSYNPDQKTLRLTYSRNAKTHTTDVAPQMTTQTDAAGAERKNFALGVVTALSLTSPYTVVTKEKTFGAMITKGFESTVNWTKITVLGFVKLFKREVSAKNIGGPIMIGKLASDTWKMGLSYFLRIMAIISINLFILNLLPVPVLDGGHLLFFTIEAVKGSPLSLKKMEIMQQVGMALLLALMVFAMFNDVVRLFAT